MDGLEDPHAEPDVRLLHEGHGQVRDVRERGVDVEGERRQHLAAEVQLLHRQVQVHAHSFAEEAGAEDASEVVAGVELDVGLQGHLVAGRQRGAVRVATQPGHAAQRGQRQRHAAPAHQLARAQPAQQGRLRAQAQLPQLQALDDRRLGLVEQRLQAVLEQRQQRVGAERPPAVEQEVEPLGRLVLRQGAPGAHQPG